MSVLFLYHYFYKNICLAYIQLFHFCDCTWNPIHLTLRSTYCTLYIYIYIYDVRLELNPLQSSPKGNKCNENYQLINDWIKHINKDKQMNILNQVCWVDWYNDWVFGYCALRQGRWAGPEHLVYVIHVVLYNER